MLLGVGAARASGKALHEGEAPPSGAAKEALSTWRVVLSVLRGFRKNMLILR